MSRVKSVLAAAHLSKEHSGCRRQIETDDLRPQIVDGEWTGDALTPNGRRMPISHLMQTQMARMMNEGRWD